MPRIFVALATYNGEKFLSEMLDSLSRQTRPADRIVAVDDASTDASRQILETYKEKLPLRIIRREKNGGHRAAFSDALEAVRTEAGEEDLIALADQDDIWLPRKLDILEKAIQTQGDDGKSHDLVFGDAEVINGKGTKIADSWRTLGGVQETLPFTARLSGTNNVNGCLSLFKAKLLKKILPIPAWIPVYDEWIAIQAEKAGGAFAVSEQVIRYRLHERNAVGNRHEMPMSQVLRTNIAVARGMSEDRNRMALSSREAAFLEHYGNFLERSLSHSPNFWELPWLFAHRDELYPGFSFSKQCKKAIGASLGFPFARRFLGKS